MENIILLKIDKDIKGRIYHSCLEANMLDVIFEAKINKESEGDLLVNLEKIPKKIRERFGLPKERNTNYTNTKNKSGVHSFYVYKPEQLEFEF